MKINFIKPINQIGESSSDGGVIISGTCTFCGDKVSFRQIGTYSISPKLKKAVAIKCEGCYCITNFVYN